MKRIISIFFKLLLSGLFFYSIITSFSIEKNQFGTSSKIKSLLNFAYAVPEEPTGLYSYSQVWEDGYTESESCGFSCERIWHWVDYHIDCGGTGTLYCEESSNLILKGYCDYIAGIIDECVWYN